jgi:hypothetical protein
MVTSLQHITTTGTAICVWLMGGGGSILSRINTVVTLQQVSSAGASSQVERKWHY